MAKYSQTVIHHNPHLAPMEDCKQKFPFMWYFNVLPLSTNCHPRYTTTNWGEQVVALYCTAVPLGDTDSNSMLSYSQRHKTKPNSVALVRERTIPTERPLPVGEVSANFSG